MAIDSLRTNPDWRRQFPNLSGHLVLLRELETSDLAAVTALLTVPDASCFGLAVPVGEDAVRDFIERARHDRAAGLSLTWGIESSTPARVLVGILQVRQLDPTFETAEWECTLSPFARGTGVFLESAQLAGTFVFTTVGAHRLESRVLLQNGRASGALRKLGAVQEGVLRRALKRGGQYLRSGALGPPERRLERPVARDGAARPLR